MELNTENAVITLRKEYDEWIKLLTEKEKYAIENIHGILLTRLIMQILSSKDSTQY